MLYRLKLLKNLLLQRLFASIHFRHVFFEKVLFHTDVVVPNVYSPFDISHVQIKCLFVFKVN